MILYIKNLRNRKQEHFIIRSFQDFYPLVQRFPMVQHMVMGSANLKESAEKVAHYISFGHLDAWVEDTGLVKSLKSKLLGAGVAAASLTSPSEPIAKDPEFDPVHVNFETCDMPENTYLEFGKHKTDPFLWNLMQIESDGGINTKHQQVQSGPSKGETAIGRWGLLRPTIQEIIRRQVKQGTVDPKILNIYHDDNKKLADFFKKRPHLELELARFLADHILKNNDYNYEKGAYAWLNGHNLRNIDHDTIKNHYYVNRYREFDKVNPFYKTLSKSEEDFGSRLDKWAKERDIMTNNPMPNFNRAYDPGRLHEDEPKPREGEIGELADAVDEAKKLSKP